MNKVSILVLEDDNLLNKAISFKIKDSGYYVFQAFNIAEAREIIAQNDIDLMIIDVNLPDGMGFDFCKEVREKRNMWIVFLSCIDDEIDLITAYNAGADDYITKPFKLSVLLSKIEVLVRRNLTKKSYTKYISGDITLLINELKVLKNGQEVYLSKTELRLLKVLMENEKNILTKEQLIESLWDVDGNFVDGNTLAVNIRRLREKIGDDAAKSTYIKNIRGVGYTWVKECIKK